MTPWKIGSVRGPGQQVHFEEPENVEPVTVMVKVEAKPLATTSYCPLTSELRLRSTCLGVTAFGITAADWLFFISWSRARAMLP